MEVTCTMPAPSLAKSDGVLKAKAAFRKHGGILRMTEAIKAGIHRRTLYAMRDAGVIEQLSRGLYRLADAPPLGNPDLVTVALKVPQGVICLISALAYHELTTQIPHQVYVAVPRNSEPPRIDYPPIRPFRFERSAFGEGIETYTIDKVKVRIYSPEKTLADCFKYRHKLGLDTTVEALRLYKERGKIDRAALLRAAEACRVAKVMRPYLEAVL
jgi:predicted transcriptional regulator of viral defense system